MPYAAEKFYKATLDANPKALFINFRLANLYMSRNMYRTAAYYLEKERARNPDFTTEPYFIIAEREIKWHLQQEFTQNKPKQSEISASAEQQTK
jgi:predicted Zn-dependent protease